MRLSRRVKEKGQELGFDLVGIAPAQPSAHADFFTRWLAQGYSGEMEYMARNLERRLNLLETMPEARSVIVVGLNYVVGEDNDPASNSSRGRIARYARGDDYHQVMQSMLQKLVEFLRGEGGRELEAKVYVDSAPILEREIAFRAGLGWFGKNTMLIHPRLGSWLLLGEIITDQELEYDQPLSADYCGTCQRCIEACPTQAILGPRVLDASLCISYLTIELKGSIPRDLRHPVGNWVFGCDICQEVCPWNKKFAKPTKHLAFQNSTEMVSLDLMTMGDMTEEGFTERFGKTPLKRAKRRGLLRNVAVALGTWGSPQAIPALKKLIADPEPLVREHAAWALGRIASGAAREALQEALSGENDRAVFSEIRLALGQISEPVLEESKTTEHYGSAN